MTYSSCLLRKTKLPTGKCGMEADDVRIFESLGVSSNACEWCVESEEVISKQVPDDRERTEGFF
jgi:hypothetical protein